MHNQNCTLRAVRTTDGQDLILRVLCIGEDGKNHLNVLRIVATGVHALASHNHTLPMIREFTTANVTFGLFPHVGSGLGLKDAYTPYLQNSVGDVLDMIIQAFEVGCGSMSTDGR